ncbi:glycoside hydrolase domain-containing protein [Pedobacter nyackensis]|uniref:glycoside hydrolase domain-containing protein n=1 Tax=Pedobacter nyackensis TaxID=475255 RepID=UPI00292CA846|nr:glycoside hydrolase domain-containing protein [Pedobacter nyackensis]
MNELVTRLFTMILLVGFFKVSAQQRSIPYTVAKHPWTETLGSQRAVVDVENASDAVRVKILWRRRDLDASQKRLIITDVKGKEVRNILRVDINREEGELIFQPNSGAGTYYIYYLPWKGEKGNGSFSGDYLKPEKAPEKNWVVNRKQLSVTKVKCIESRTGFDSFYPMEVIATASEIAMLGRKYPHALLLFPEDRKNPIRMRRDIPSKWIDKVPSALFLGNAERNEYYTFQIGAFALKQDVKNLKIAYSKMPFKITCFNIEGNDSRGKYFTKKINVAKGEVQSLWFGVDIPQNTKPGKYSFDVIVSGEGIAKQTVPVRLTVSGKVIAERGDYDLWRHSRLRWLNSSLGISDESIAPFTPLEVKGHTIKAKTAAIKLNDRGLPMSIKANENELLDKPLLFTIETSEGPEKLNAAITSFKKKATGVVEWITQSENEKLKLICEGTMESDGHLDYKITVVPKKDLLVKDIRLELLVRESIVEYFMGMGLPGMNCPSEYNWKWKGPQDSFWIGNTKAGIHVELKGASYSGPLLNLYRPLPPPSWFNENNGGFSIGKDGSSVLNRIYSGARQLKAGVTVNFEFTLLITPVKDLDTKSQFVNRYYHNGSDPLPKDQDIKTGIKIFNVHHANAINPYINYPFTTMDTIKSVAKSWHEKGLKVKLYYTTRELTNQVSELWALRSLGTEVLADGNGGGYMWLREHLVDGYNAQWFTTVSGYERSDAALLTSGDSRWYNYYIEGLRWLIKQTDIDGLYLDDVSYDRHMLKRMRRVMDAVKPGCILDLHSNTGFSRGPATQYTEFFPYLNKLWFGESFQYDKMSPANWLVEVSGIPFGHMGDMLHGGGNPWRGMVYGMTVRYPWFTEGVNCDPRDIWKIWDDFGIDKAKMIGYWDEKKVVTTDHPDVLATVYVKQDKLLISVASWAKDAAKIKLKIDWDKIGWKPKTDSLIARKINGFQEGIVFGLTDEIQIQPAKGWLLEVN